MDTIAQELELLQSMLNKIEHNNIMSSEVKAAEGCAGYYHIHFEGIKSFFVNAYFWLDLDKAGFRLVDLAISHFSNSVSISLLVIRK